MKISIYLRNMGPPSETDVFSACVAAADDSALDTVWLADHIAIPPDDAEGSGGRYLDALACSAWIAGATRRVRFGPGVLVLPYRPALATAKWVATIQELAGGRFRFGIGVGWMDAEFRASGADRSKRGQVSDEILDFVHRAFAADEVESNGQPMLFLPRPERPEILVGGAPPHALRRAARFGDGWMPFARDPDKLRGDIAELQRLFAEAGKGTPQVCVITPLDLSDRGRAAAQVEELRAVGATEVVHGAPYSEAAEFRRAVDALSALVD